MQNKLNDGENITKNDNENEFNQFDWHREAHS